MAMTKAQQSYALGKITTIVDAKVKETREAEGWSRVSLRQDERHHLIVSGKVKLKKDLSKCVNNYNTNDYFDFSTYEKSSGISKKGQARIDKLLTAKSKASDEAMLGDSAEALELLRTIEGL